MIRPKHVQRWCAALCAAITGTAAAQPGTPPEIYINEVFVNPPGADNGSEYFEIRSCDPFRPLEGLTFLVIEGDGAAAGTIDQALPLTGQSTGGNGLFLWRDATVPMLPPPEPGTNIFIQDFVPDIENGGQTYMLVRGFTGSVGQDLDTDNDGVLDLAPWGAVIDAVAYSEASPAAVSRTYADDVGGVTFPQLSFTPDWIGRNRCCLWFGADVTGSFPGPFTFNPLFTATAAGVPINLGAFTATPGSSNAYPCGGPTVLGFQPPEAGPGDLVQIVGTGFGNNPDNLCVVVMNGPRLIPLTAIQANEDIIVARLNSVPEDAEPGPIMVMLGRHTRGTFEPNVTGIIPEDPRGTWIWEGPPQDAGASPTFFRPIPRPPPPTVTWYNGVVQPGQDGTICIFFREPWMPNSYIRVISRLHGRVGCCRFDFYDEEIGCVRFRNGGSALDCARKVCDTIVCAFAQRGIIVDCRVRLQADGSVKLEISLPPGAVLEHGTLSVCVEMPRKVFFPNDWFATPFFGAELNPATPGVLVNIPPDTNRAGLAGATIDMGPNHDGLQTELLAMDLRAAAGGQLELQAWGQVGPDSHRPLGTVHGRFAPDSFFDIFVDFSPIETNRTMVQVLDEGNVVDERLLPTGAIARIVSPNGVPVSGCGKLVPRFPFPLPCYYIDFRNRLPIQLVGGFGPTVGDEIRILAIDAPLPIDDIKQFDIAAGGIDGFQIVSAGPLDTGDGCPACAADFNQDGGIDGSDVGAFFDVWEAGRPCGDVNEDGGIDGSDVGAFFAVWEAGGC